MSIYDLLTPPGPSKPAPPKPPAPAAPAAPAIPTTIFDLLPGPAAPRPAAPALPPAAAPTPAAIPGAATPSAPVTPAVGAAAAVPSAGQVIAEAGQRRKRQEKVTELRGQAAANERFERLAAAVSQRAGISLAQAREELARSILRGYASTPELRRQPGLMERIAGRLGAAQRGIDEAVGEVIRSERTLDQLIPRAKVVLGVAEAAYAPGAAVGETYVTPKVRELATRAGLPPSNVDTIGKVAQFVTENALDPVNLALLGSSLTGKITERAVLKMLQARATKIAAAEAMTADDAVRLAVVELAKEAKGKEARALQRIASRIGEGKVKLSVPEAAPAPRPEVPGPRAPAQPAAALPPQPPRAPTAVPRPTTPVAPAGMQVRTSAGSSFTAEELQRTAQTQAPAFMDHLRSVAQRSGTRFGPEVDARLGQTTVKSVRSIQLKGARGDTIDDALRQTLIINDPAELDAVLRELQGEGFTILNVKNRYALGERGYRDINIKMVHADDPRLVAEVQLLTPEMLQRKMAFGHDLYDLRSKYLEELRADVQGSALDEAEKRTLMQQIDGRVGKALDEMLVKVYEDVDRGVTASRMRPASARAAVTEAAVSGERPSITAARELPESRRAAISASLVSSEPGAAIPGVPSISSVAPAPPRVQPVIGRTSQATGARGTRVQTRLAVYDARDLQPSHQFVGTELQPNPVYPQDLQPRLRERAASLRQVEDFTGKIDPARLADDPSISRGAPIVGEDLFVESGNARTLGLTRAYQLNHPNAQRYKQWLLDHADELGLDRAAIEAMEQPVLVRVRQTPVDRVKFVREANEGSRAAMSAVEVARSDATVLSDDLMQLFTPSETGEIITPANRDFVRRFMHQVVSPADQARYMTATGEINQEGVHRVRNAIFAKAYGDISAIEKLAEATDVNVRNIVTGMLRAAPRMASIKSRIAQGALHNLDITDDVVQAMNKLSTLRETGMPVETYLAQSQLFGEELTPEAKRLLETFGKARGQKPVGDILNRYADLVEAAGDPRQVTLLERAAPAKGEVLERAIQGTSQPVLPIERPAAAPQPPQVAPAAPAEAPVTREPVRRPPVRPQRAKRALQRATPADLAALDQLSALSPKEATAIRGSVDQALGRFRAAGKMAEPRTRAEVNRVADDAYAVYRRGVPDPQVDQAFFRRYVAAEVLEPEGFGAAPAIQAATAKNLEEVGAGMEQAGFIRLGGAAPSPSAMPPAVRRALDVGRPGVRERMAVSWQRTRDLLRNYFTFEGQLIGVRTTPGHTWQELRDDFRLFRDVPRIDVPRRVIDDIAGVVAKLDQTEYHTLSDYLVLRDWREELQVAMREGRPASVPFGLSEDEVATAIRDAESRLNQNIRGAVERYDRLKKAQQAEFVRRGYGDEEAFRQYHFRHFVIDYDELYGGTIGMPRGRLREPFRKYLKGRAGSQRPILTDTVNVLNKEFSRFYIDNAVDDFYDEIAPKIDFLRTLSKEDRIRLFGPGGRPTKAGELVTLPNGTKAITWQYHPGNRVFPAFTVGGRITEGVTSRVLTVDELQALLKSVDDPEVAKAARQMLVLGQKYPMIVVDPKVSSRLNQFISGAQADRMFRHVEALTGLWKRALIDSLGLPFQVQNLIGDLENGMVIGDALPKTSLGRSTLALSKKAMGMRLTTQEEEIVRLAERLRVVRSGFVGGFLKRNPRLDARLRHLLAPGERLARAPEEALQVYETIAGVREDAVRMAHFWDNLDRIHAGQQVRVSAAIDISGLAPERAAAKAAREAFIDYGGRSPFEDQFRSVLAPFVTWFYQNTRNWTRLAVRDPAKIAIKAVPLYAAMMTWNNTGARADIERKLPRWRQTMPHLITGWELPDGRPLIITFQTASSSAASALGLTRLYNLAQRVVGGELALETAVKKAPVEMGQEAIRGIAFSLGPGVTVPAEVGIYGVTAAAGKPVALDIRRGAPRIPERLRGTRAGLREFAGEEARTAVPPVDILLRQREGARTTPPGTSPAIRAAMATGGLRPVDLAAEARSRGIERAETAEAALEDKLYRVEQAFIKEGQVGANTELRSVNKAPGPKVTPDAMMRRLVGTRVQIARVREQLRTAKTDEEARRLRRRLESLLKRAERERLRQVPVPARPFAIPP